MLKRCLFCRLPFAPNDTLEAFPVARRVAYDPGRGRLWAVCQGCARWSLAPIEERWEALEELERLTRDRGRLLAETDQVALIQAGDMQVVRVGQAGLEEEAWWRYGKAIRQRHRTYKVLRRVEKTARFVGFFALNWLILFTPKEPLNNAARWYRFGRTAWKGEAPCERCGAVRKRVAFTESDNLILGLDPMDEKRIAVAARCARCAWGPMGRLVTPPASYDRAMPPGHLITGVQAEHLMRRVMAHRNHTGATDGRISAAIGMIEAMGGPEQAVLLAAATDSKLQRTMGGTTTKARTQAVALEIALNDASERRLLELEAASLEARWREEEELAAIIDRDLTPVPAALRHMLSGLRPRTGSDP